MAIRASSQQLAFHIWRHIRAFFGHVSSRNMNAANLLWSWISNTWTQIQAVARGAWRWSKDVAAAVLGWFSFTWRWIVNTWPNIRAIATSVWRLITLLVDTITFSLTASFLAAIAFAIAHHLFYQSLANTVAPSGDTGISGFLQNASGQSYNIAIGTLLATITAALFGVSIKTTHDQLSWNAAKAKPADLQTLDHLFSRNIWSLSLWHRYSGPEILALLLWFLPFLPIIAPAQLNIQSVLVNSSTMMAVPTIAFGNGNFTERIASGRDDDSAGIYRYGGPLSPVRKAVTQSLVAGAIVDIPAPFPNSTYSIEFHGPALRCEEISKGSFLWTNQSTTVQNASVREGQYYYYISWAGASLYPWGTSNGFSIFDPPTGIQGLPVSLTVIGNADAIESGTLDMTLIQCQLWNASYAASFSYGNGVQNVSSTISSYEHTMDAILAVGAIELDYSFHRNWSYLTVMDVFQDFVTGSITFAFGDNLGGSPTIATSMIITSLVSSDELMPLSTPISGLGSSERKISMKDTLESMFRNATISLASQTPLLDSDTKPNTMVTTYTSQNQYTYSANVLWLAYGVGTGVSLISMLLGLYRVHSANGGYKTSFSTILRVANNVQLSSVIDLRETSGKAPLPERLESTLVYLPPDGQQAPAGLLPAPPPKQHLTQLRLLWQKLTGGSGIQYTSVNAAQQAP